MVPQKQNIDSKSRVRDINNVSNLNYISTYTLSNHADPLVDIDSDLNALYSIK